MTRVSVIIPTFNRLHDLQAVLAALAVQTFRDFEVIVVDNGSTDGTEAALTAWPGPFPLRYMRISPSGPAGARNRGIAAAAGDLLAFVDSDVELSPNWLESTVREIDGNPGLSAVGGAVIYANDRSFVNAYGGELSRIGLAWDADEGQPRSAITAPAERLWINCSAMLARADLVRAAGGFDGRFFYGYEDTDLGWRMSAIGGPARVIPGARALHNVGNEIGPAHDQLVFHGCKNRLASLIANAGPGWLALWLPVALVYALADAALRAPRGPKARALWWNLTHLGGTLTRRRQLARARHLSDAALRPLLAPGLFPRVRLNGMRRRPNRVQDLTTARDDRAA